MAGKNGLGKDEASEYRVGFKDGGTLAQMQPIAGTRVDAYSSKFTVEALRGMADQVNNGVRKQTVGLEHDRIAPPLGVTIAGHVESSDDGHYRLLVEYDFFSEPIPVDLPTGETGYRQFSEKARHPFKNAEFNEDEQITIAADFANFELSEESDKFFSEIRRNQLTEFKPSRFERRAVENAPELIITLSLSAAGIWLASQVVKATGESVADEVKNIYSLLRTAIVKYASYAHPKNRPITYVLQVPGTPNLEFVARSSDPHKVMLAFTNGSHVGCHADALSYSQRFDNTEFVQFVLSDDGRWRFNYLLTRNGDSIGSRQAYSHRAKLLKQLEESAGGWSISGTETLQEPLNQNGLEAS